ncbi:MAG: purine/pyrimidine permease [Gammaproteobacteria bacterium]|nr:purine/pyrimidine permease [Gammaproteobacteria bacterium]
MANDADQEAKLSYQVDENPPLRLTVGIGFQFALLSLSAVMLIPAVAFRAGGMEESTTVWAVFATMIICGAVMVLHARPIGRFGSGYVTALCPPTAAIAVTADALAFGGLTLLAALTFTAAVVQFAFALRISLLRRLLTPTVSGTALMLIPVTVFPVIFGMFDDLPASHSNAVAPVCAGVAILVIGGINLKGGANLRSWAPLLAIFTGSCVALYFDAYDTQRIVNAAWVGIPTGWPTNFNAGTPAIDFESFLALAPAFVLLFLICSIRAMSSSLAIQSVSWRNQRTMDFRPVQGTLAADAASNVAAGLVGTMPNCANSGSVARIQLTGVASRTVGVFYGIGIVLLAFCPKVVALILAVPAPVYAGYVTVMLATTFTVGLKMAVSERVDQRQGMIIGLAFWIGAGCQYGFIFPEFVASFAGGMFNNALTTGGLIAILLSAVLVATSSRRDRFESSLSISSLSVMREFVSDLTSRHEWSTKLSERIDAIIEESIHTLLRNDQEATVSDRRLLLVVHRESNAVELEFIAAGGHENIEDRLAVLGETATEESIERDVSLRLLRHLADDVRHRQYYDVDILTVRVDGTS